MTIKKLALVFVGGAGLLTLAACHQEGPAERAGKSMDSTGQKIQDAISPPGPLQKAGRTIDKAVQ
jgi:hypothetical protein